MAALFNRKSNPDEMSFLQHLEALRWHLVRSVVAVCVLAVVAFLNKALLFDGIILAPKKSSFITYRFFCWLARKVEVDFCISEIPFSLQSTELSKQFTLHMWVAFVAGFILSAPYIFWELWQFFKPALSAKERKYTTGVVFFASLLFLTGVLFGYFVIAPLSINFLGTYTVSDQVQNIFTLDSFISIIVFMTLASGIVFELPIVIYFLSKIGIVTPAFLRAYRRHAIVIILIIAAVITPSPDVTSQMLVAVPLYLLFEVSILISSFVYNRRGE